MSWPLTPSDAINIISKGVHHFWPSGSSELNIPSCEQNIDPFALRIAFAIRGFYDEDYKPTLKNHHIIWDPPNEYVLGNTKMAKQACDRSYNGDYSSRKVTMLWENCIKIGNLWYEPYKANLSASGMPFVDNLTKPQKTLDELAKACLEEIPMLEKELQLTTLKDFAKQAQDLSLPAEQQKRQKQIFAIFALGIAGIKKTALTYARMDKSIDTALEQRLNRCEESIENGLKRPEDPLKKTCNEELVRRYVQLWDNQTIDQIYRYFEDLKTLIQEPTPINQKHKDDIIMAIEGIINEKCTQFEKIHQEQTLFGPLSF